MMMKNRILRLEKAVGMQKDRAAKIVLSFRAYYGGDEIPDPEPGESARLFIADFGDEGHNEKQIE